MARDPTSDAVSVLENALQKRIDSFYETAQSHERYARTQFDFIVKAGMLYRDSGVALADTHIVHAFEWLKVVGTPREYFKAIADSLGRPFVYVEYSHAGYLLRIPRTKAMENIVAPLLVVVPEGKIGTVHDRYRQQECVVRNETPQRWLFNFKHAEGELRLKQWMEMCRTNAVAKIILKVP